MVETYAGIDFYNRFIKEPLRAMVRKNIQVLASRQVKEKRKEIAEAVVAELTSYLNKTPFIVVSGVVGNIDYPKVVTEAVEKRFTDFLMDVIHTINWDVNTRLEE